MICASLLALLESFFEMAENRRCVTCGRSVLRGRRHILSLEFSVSHRDFVDYMFGTLQHPQEVSCLFGVTSVRDNGINYFCFSFISDCI